MLPARIIITSFICYFILVTLRRMRFGLRVTYHMSLWYLFLGKKKFLLGERACSADSAVFGLLAQIHWHSYGSEAENVYKSRWFIHVCVVQFLFAAGGNKYKNYIYCNRLIQCFEHIIKRTVVPSYQRSTFQDTSHFNFYGLIMKYHIISNNVSRRESQLMMALFNKTNMSTCIKYQQIISC